MAAKVPNEESPTVSPPRTSPGSETTIAIITLGGTIASRRSSGNIVSILDPSEVQKLLQSYWPTTVSSRTVSIAPMNKLSENMHPRDWVAIAQTVRGVAYDSGVHGVAILHGTDTMAFTSAALSILLQDCPVPVVLTGSILTTDQPDSDAIENLQATATAIQHLSPGVYVCLDHTVHLGTNVGKVSGPDQPRFVSLNRKPVARIVGDALVSIEPNARGLQSTPLATSATREAFDTTVVSLSLFPGLSFGLLAPALPGIRGLVVELYVSATAPNFAGPYSLPQFVKNQCTEHGVLVVATLPPDEGGRPGHPDHVYTSMLALEQAGALILRDITREFATVKLMWALAQSHDLGLVKTLMASEL